MAVLSVAEAKGLEFDSVIVVEPELIAWASRRAALSDLYVALTRATQRLGVVHERPLSALLSEALSGLPSRASGPTNGPLDRFNATT